MSKSGRRKKNKQREKGQTRLSITLPRYANVKAIYGSKGTNLDIIAERADVEIDAHGPNIDITGGNGTTRRKVKQVFEELARTSRNSDSLSDNDVERAFNKVFNIQTKQEPANQNITPVFNGEGPVLKMKNKVTIGPRSDSQGEYLQKIFNNVVTFGVGPAGTGKTYLAVAAAVYAFENDPNIKSIILTRPAMEAGERLGFLPGDLKEKIDPYLRPLYDALYEMKGASQVNNMIANGRDIEIAPLAFMRGRTLKNAFIILDEAQNTTPEQMKMILTRLGEGSKLVVTGDGTQSDLPKGETSGLHQAVKMLGNSGDHGIGIHKFEDVDVVRHQTVAHIVQTYGKHGL